MCGEKIGWNPAVVPDPGSPPHVRGKVEENVISYTIPGITPACAGKRSGIDNATVSLRDHPRMCGEKGRLGASSEWW